MSAEAYNAKIHGTMATFETVTSSYHDIKASTIHVPLGNFAAVGALIWGNTVSLPWLVYNFWGIAAKVSTSVTMGWTPEHTVIIGNESLDKPAYREPILLDNSTYMIDRLTVAAVGRKSSALTRQLLKD